MAGRRLVCTPARSVVELSAMVGAKMLLHSLHPHHIGQCRDDSAPDQRRFARTKRLSRVCSSIKIEQPYAAAIVCSCEDEVLAPHVVPPFRSQLNTRPVVKPQPAKWLCFCGTFSPSRRQIRSTRSLPTRQPARLSSAVISNRFTPCSGCYFLPRPHTLSSSSPLLSTGTHLKPGTPMHGLHHAQRTSFRNKEDRFVRDCSGDDVRNGLRLPGARRALE